MITLEFKTYGKLTQFSAIDEAIRTAQFVRNKCLRLWIDGDAKTCFDLNKYTKLIADEFEFADKLNSSARQASAERTWAAITRFYENCKKKIQHFSSSWTTDKGLKPLVPMEQSVLIHLQSAVSSKKGYPQFQKDCRSVEYKTSGWKLAPDKKSITFTDKHGIGKLKMKGTRDLNFYQPEQIKRVRLIKRADGYYAQFCVQVERNETIKPTHRTIGLDVGLESFYTDSLGNKVENPRFYRTGEQRLRKSQRRVSKKIKGSSNRRKARTHLGKVHLKISRQRKDHAVKLARCVVQSNDLIAYEDLRIKNLVKNHCLAKSINDAGWYQFRVWLEYFAKVLKRVTIAVPPAYTSQQCSNCGVIVKKSLSTRTHACQCGCKLDRDHNAGINILNSGLGTVGHTGTFAIDASNASGDVTSTLVGVIQSGQVVSLKEEFQCL